MTPRTLKVEAVDFDAQIILVETCLLAHVELGPNIQKVAACITAHRHGQHHTHVILLVAGSDDLLELRVVKVWRVILIENFSFRHIS